MLPIAVAPWLAMPAKGQRPTDDDWHWSFTPFLWFAGTKGTVGVGNAVVAVDFTYADAWESLRTAFAGLLEGRRGPWVLRFDASYSGLSEDLSTDPVPISLDMDQYWLAPTIGYVVLDWPTGAVDISAGLRYWRLTTGLTATVPGSIDESRGESWVDGVAGLGIRMTPWSPRFHLIGYGDAGAGGAEFTWQAVGGLTFDLSACCSLGAAYRHLAVDYESSSLLNDIKISGPALSIGLRF